MKKIGFVLAAIALCFSSFSASCFLRRKTIDYYYEHPDTVFWKEGLDSLHSKCETYLKKPSRSKFSSVTYVDMSCQYQYYGEIMSFALIESCLSDYHIAKSELSSCCEIIVKDLPVERKYHLFRIILFPLNIAYDEETEDFIIN